MQPKAKSLNIRWLYLAVGAMAMLVGGVIYAWSIFKVPFAEEFGWSISQLAFNYTLMLCCFCVGTIVGGIFIKKYKLSIIIIGAGLLAGGGFILSSLQQGSIFLLYITYAICAGTGIGCFYIVLLTTVNSWFPEKRGLSSGSLMMGFGLSVLVFGTILDNMFNNENIGWRKAFLLLGLLIIVVLTIAGLIIKAPGPDVVLPEIKGSSEKQKSVFPAKDYEVGEMLKSANFWLIFVFLMSIGAVGNCIVNFAKEFLVSVGAAATLATTLVGVMSVFNGLGRVTVGIAFDILGRKKTTFIISLLILLVPAVMIIAVLTNSLALAIVGYCVLGYCHGSLSPTTSIFVSTFFGVKNFGVNYGIVGSNMMGSSIITSILSVLLAATNTYVAPLIALIGFAALAFVLNIVLSKRR